MIFFQKKPLKLGNLRPLQTQKIINGNIMKPVGGNAIAPTRNRSRNNASSKKHKWTTEEDALLTQIAQGCESVNWKAAEAQFPGKTSQQIFERWTKVLDPSLLKGSWTRQEDETIIQYVRTYGCKSWTKLAKMLPGRIGKQCRERWMNHLNPNISRGPWTPEEDYQLMILHEQFGNSWAKIAASMPTRADNMIKNRWYSTISKKSKEEITESVANRERIPPPSIQTKTTQSETVLPKPTFDEMSIEPVWTPSNGGNTPFAGTPFNVTPSFAITPTMGGTPSSSLGLISPMVPSASPFTLMSPYQKMTSMFSPWAADTPKGSFLSPMRQKCSPPSLSENRAELVNLIVHQ